MIGTVINVALDAPCKRCGKGGAVGKSGVCMKCIARGIKDGEFDPILDRHKPKLPEE